MSVYFGSYHKARDNGYNSFISGGISGLANWTFSYPIDVIMSRQIAQNISISQAYKLREPYGKDFLYVLLEL